MTQPIPDPDRYDLYERCVQSPLDVVTLLNAIHAGAPLALAEDFAGTNAVSRAWTAQSNHHTAVAADTDNSALLHAPAPARLTRLIADVTADPRLADHRADVLFVGNFSIGYLHTRKDLVAYLGRSRARLNPRAILVLDTYGGSEAFGKGSVHRNIPLGGGRHVRYTFQRRAADPLTGLVENAVHFRVFAGGEAFLDLTDAFVYRWRLWSIAELREALHEAGFTASQVFAQVPAGPGQAVPVTAAADLGDNWAVCIAGRI